MRVSLDRAMTAPAAPAAGPEAAPALGFVAMLLALLGIGSGPVLPQGVLTPPGEEPRTDGDVDSSRAHDATIDDEDPLAPRPAALGARRAGWPIPTPYPAIGETAMVLATSAVPKASSVAPRPDMSPVLPATEEAVGERAPALPRTRRMSPSDREPAPDTTQHPTADDAPAPSETRRAALAAPVLAMPSRPAPVTSDPIAGAQRPERPRGRPDELEIDMSAPGLGVPPVAAERLVTPARPADDPESRETSRERTDDAPPRGGSLSSLPVEPATAPRPGLPVEAPPPVSEARGSSAEARQPLSQQVVRSARMLLREGLTQMEVRLDPPSLGAIMVTAAARPDGIGLTISAERPETLVLLTQAVPEIQALLADRGIAATAIAVGSTDHRPGHDPIHGRRDQSRTRPDDPRGGPRRSRSSSEPVTAVDLTV